MKLNYFHVYPYAPTSHGDTQICGVWRVRAAPKGTCVAPLECLGDICIITGPGSKNLRKVGGSDISPGRDGKSASGETVLCNATVSCDNIYDRILWGFLSVRRHASRGYIGILLHYNSGSFLFLWFIAECYVWLQTRCYVWLQTRYTGYVWLVMFGFRQGIQVEERTKFCFHSNFESL